MLRGITSSVINAPDEPGACVKAEYMLHCLCFEKLNLDQTVEDFAML